VYFLPTHWAYEERARETFRFSPPFSLPPSFALVDVGRRHRREGLFFP